MFCRHHMFMGLILGHVVCTKAFTSTSIQICYNKTWRGKCPLGESLVFVYANYGRTDQSTCGSSWIGNCGDPSDSLYTLQQKCFGQNECFITVTDDHFAKNCKLASRKQYLDFEYLCMPDNAIHSMDCGRTLSVSTDDGGILSTPGYPGLSSCLTDDNEITIGSGPDSVLSLHLIDYTSLYDINIYMCEDTLNIVDYIINGCTKIFIVDNHWPTSIKININSIALVASFTVVQRLQVCQRGVTDNVMVNTGLIKLGTRISTHCTTHIMLGKNTTILVVAYLTPGTSAGYCDNTFLIWGENKSVGSSCSGDLHNVSSDYIYIFTSPMKIVFNTSSTSPVIYYKGIPDSVLLCEYGTWNTTCPQGSDLIIVGRNQEYLCAKSSNIDTESLGPTVKKKTCSLKSTCKPYFSNCGEFIKDLVVTFLVYPESFITLMCEHQGSTFSATQGILKYDSSDLNTYSVCGVEIGQQGYTVKLNILVNTAETMIYLCDNILNIGASHECATLLYDHVNLEIDGKLHLIVHSQNRNEYIIVEYKVSGTPTILATTSSSVDSPGLHDTQDTITEQADNSVIIAALSACLVIILVIVVAVFLVVFLKKRKSLYLPSILYNLRLRPHPQRNIYSGQVATTPGSDPVPTVTTDTRAPISEDVGSSPTPGTSSSSLSGIAMSDNEEDHIYINTGDVSMSPTYSNMKSPIYYNVHMHPSTINDDNGSSEEEDFECVVNLRKRHLSEEDKTNKDKTNTHDETNADDKTNTDRETNADDKINTDDEANTDKETNAEDETSGDDETTIIENNLYPNSSQKGNYLNRSSIHVNNEYDSVKPESIEDRIYVNI